ncbi:MAG: TolC family protein [Bryobacteraceae bacterium]
MLRVQPIVALLLCAIVALPGFGQTQSFAQDPSHGVVAGVTRPFRAHPVNAVSFADSPRIDKLMRAGSIYLSLRDAIALALENNLDLESVRYTPKLEESNLLRASAGQLLRNFSTNITQAPSSASLGVLSGNSQVNSAGTTSTSGNANSGVLSGVSVTLAGSTIPNTDPYFYIAGGFYHSTAIETSTEFTGTDFFVQQFKNLIYGVQQGFWTGTTVSLGLSSVFGSSQNAITALYNPIDTASASLTITQNLLNGFGLAVNKRAYHEAQNNLKAGDLTFKTQVITTVAGVVNLYYDLVTYNDELKVSQQTLQLDTQLYEDNKKRADLGAVAPIDIISAESDMKAAQQDVVQRESQVLQQEMILKNYITRSGLDVPAVAMARIIPTDHIDVPPREAVIPWQDLVAEAISHRPEIEQNQIALENARLELLGTRNALLPTLSVSATLANNGQAGAVNSNGVVPILNSSQQIIGTRPLTAADVNPFLLGGYGTALSQVFDRNFPNYSVAFTLTVPIRNRSAQADHITAELNYRQSEIQDRQLHNSVKLAVMNNWTALRNARAAYETSAVSRKLADETLAGTRRKYDLGTSTILDVMIAQRDDTNRRLSEVDALSQLQHSRTSMDQSLGKILDDYGVSLEEAMSGQVRREPDLPVAPPKP